MRFRYRLSNRPLCPLPPTKPSERPWAMRILEGSRSERRPAETPGRRGSPDPTGVPDRLSPSDRSRVADGYVGTEYACTPAPLSSSGLSAPTEGRPTRSDRTPATTMQLFIWTTSSLFCRFQIYAPQLWKSRTESGHVEANKNCPVLSKIEMSHFT